MKLYIIMDGYELQLEDYPDTSEGAQNVLERLHELADDYECEISEIKVIRGEQVTYVPPSGQENLAINGKNLL